MSFSIDGDLSAIDRAVAKAAVAALLHREALAVTTPLPATFEALPLASFRDVSGKRAFDALGARSTLAHEALHLAALRRWVRWLTVERVTEEIRVEVARAETEDDVVVELETTTKTSFRGGWKGLVGARTAAEGTAWLDALGPAGPKIAALRRRHAAHTEEAHRLLGDETEAERLRVIAPHDLDAAARTFLDETRELAAALRREAERRDGGGPRTFVEATLGSVARGAGEGWPAKLSERTVVEMLGAPSDVAAGLRVKIRLPEALGAASFARALGAFGAAYRRAAAFASPLPFALANEPEHVDIHRFGLAFAGLPAGVLFQRRALGVGERAAYAQARSLSESALLAARTVAFAWLADRNRLRPDASRWAERTEDLFGRALVAGLEGAFPRFSGDEASRLVALLTVLPFTRDLRERFDEDWFRNPHAWRALRGRATGLSRLPDDPALAPKELARAFEEALR